LRLKQEIAKSIGSQETVWDAEAIDTSRLGFRPIQKIALERRTVSV
jgi:hypothetical protein